MKNWLRDAIQNRHCLRKNSAIPLISEVRGEGLLLAVRLKILHYIQYVIAHAPDHGLILDYFLFCGDAFRIAPPLIISENEIIMACKLLRELLDEAGKNTIIP